MRDACSPGRPCEVTVAADRAIAAGAYVRVTSRDATLTGAEIDPVDGATRKDDPTESLHPRAQVSALTGPVWASDVRRARVRVSVAAPARVRIAIGTLRAGG